MMNKPISKKIIGLVFLAIFALAPSQLASTVSQPINPHFLFKTTYYCPGPCCNDKWAGITKTGKPLKYGVVAIDPKYWKMGQKFRMKGLDSDTIFVAEDVGSAIKGKKRMDICLHNHKEAYSGHPEYLVVEVLK